MLSQLVHIGHAIVEVLLILCKFAITDSEYRAGSGRAMDYA